MNRTGKRSTGSRSTAAVQPSPEAIWNGKKFTGPPAPSATPREQFAQSVRAAALWTASGLYFAFEVEDADITARMKDGDTLWLEDAVELFLARHARPGEPFLELQLSPANAVYLVPPPGKRCRAPAPALPLTAP